MQGESQFSSPPTTKPEQVHILRRNGGRTVVEIPDEHPQGMGVTRLLKSELFGLSSTLEIETERRLFRRNELFVKSSRTPEVATGCVEKSYGKTALLRLIGTLVVRALAPDPEESHSTRQLYPLMTSK